MAIPSIRVRPPQPAPAYCREFSDRSFSATTTAATGLPPTVSADGLPTWQINGVVWSQVVVNNIVYATGSFTKARPPGVAAGGAGEVDAQNIFAYDITTGQRVSTFNHSLNAQGLAIAASPDGSRVYVGGDFTAVDGIARGHVASFQTASGALDLNFAPKVQGQVRALAVASTKVFVGGAFATVNGQSRQSLAAVDAINGSELAWAPMVDSERIRVWSMVLAPDRSRVIVGGSFTTINGQAAYGMGSVDATTGASLPWAANQKIRDAARMALFTACAPTAHKSMARVIPSARETGNFEGTFAANPTLGTLRSSTTATAIPMMCSRWEGSSTASAMRTIAVGSGVSRIPIPGYGGSGLWRRQSLHSPPT